MCTLQTFPQNTVEEERSGRNLWLLEKSSKKKRCGTLPGCGAGAGLAWQCFRSNGGLSLQGLFLPLSTTADLHLCQLDVADNVGV